VKWGHHHHQCKRVACTRGKKLHGVRDMQRRGEDLVIANKFWCTRDKALEKCNGNEGQPI
jgi:hypothetical protein